MVKIATSVLGLAALAHSALALTCTVGTYCGSRLIAENQNNRADIVAALTAAKQPTDEQHITNSVFFCGAGLPGVEPLMFVSFCGTRACVVGGQLGNGDACAIS